MPEKHSSNLAICAMCSIFIKLQHLYDRFLVALWSHPIGIALILGSAGIVTEDTGWVSGLWDWLDHD